MLSLMLHPFIYSLIYLFFFSSKQNYNIPGNIAKPARPEIQDVVPVLKDTTVYVVGETNLWIHHCCSGQQLL